MAQNRKPQDALRFAVAAGSAAMLARGTGLCDTDDVMRLAGQVEVLEVETA
jgi:6-phosphofructokinase 2